MGRPRGSLTPSCWNLLREFPPALVYLTARIVVIGTQVRSLSKEEVAIVTGIPLSRVIVIRELMSWESVTIGEAELFCGACGFDPTNADHRRRQRQYIASCQTKSNQPPAYLRRSPQWTSEYLPLIQRLKSHRQSLENSTKSPSLASR